MFKNGHLRLLMTLVGFRRVRENDDPEASWTIPSSLTADQLKEALDLVKKSEFSPPVFDDGQEAGDFIKRKSAPTTSRKRAVFDDEDDGIDNDDDEEELLFEPGGPTASKKSDALLALKKIRRRRQREGTEDGEGGGLTEEQLKEREDARLAKELEKIRKVKSEMYVQDSEDDEKADAAFFAKEQEIRDRTTRLFHDEEKMRQRNNITKMKELLHVGRGKAKPTKSKKRQSSAMAEDSDDEDAMLPASSRRSSATVEGSDDGVGRISARSSSAARENVLAESEEEATDNTPMSSPHARPSQSKRRKVLNDVDSDSADEDTEPPDQEPVKTVPTMVLDDKDDEDDDVAPVARPTRQRVRSGFIVDSSDED